jgi:hypothetical protein
MSFHPGQFKDLIERALNELDPILNTPVAVKLLLGTCAQESRFGMSLRQLGTGPAVGVFQMEPVTFRDMQDRFGDRFPKICGRRVEEMEWDLKLAIWMCRIKYWSINAPLPEDLLTELAKFWKLYYNTPKGMGTEQQFVDNYHRYVGAI